MPPKRLHFTQWIELWEIDDAGNRHIPANDTITDWFYDHNEISITIDKSISSNLDNASITIQNHIALEEMYSKKKFFFEQFFKKQYEVDIMMLHHCSHWTETPNVVSCIFSGDLDDIYASSDSSVTDQGLILNLVAGKRATVRTIVNKKYPAGMTYRAIVEDLFSLFGGYELYLIDDPNNKLSKVTPKPRTVHGKVYDVLNDIARDLEMTFGFDCNPWKLSERRQGGTDGSTGFDKKHCYWVDKISVFDSLGVNGIGPHDMNGSTGKIGRIGYTKAQFTVEHIYDPVFNIGMLVNASDFGTMNNAVDFLGRITRMSVSSEVMNIEAHYASGGKAIINHDKAHTGGMVI